MDDGLLINGRGYGGGSILWKSTLNAKVTPILMHSNRVDGLFNSVLEYYSLHEGTNLSFHSPIILTLHINVEYSSCHTTTNIPKPKWQESTNHDLREYANALDKALREIQIPWEALQCCDKSCTMHFSELQIWVVFTIICNSLKCIVHDLSQHCNAHNPSTQNQELGGS